MYLDLYPNLFKMPRGVEICSVSLLPMDGTKCANCGVMYTQAMVDLQVHGSNLEFDMKIDYVRGKKGNKPLLALTKQSLQVNQP